jgi:NAD(P)-dependent dehydrogenase (short-subunit alcohol dehydrogenase family)
MMARDLRGRRILITGASGGIGRCLAEQAFRAGARVALTARSGDKLDEIVRGLGGPSADVVAVPADVTSETDRHHLLQTVVERFDGLDILINNAGVGSWGHFADCSEAILRQVMEVNFFAPAELIRGAIPVLTRGVQPAVVNVSSMCGRRGMPAWPEYSASKFALCGLTEALRAELARFDIDVLLILPGLTRNGLGGRLLRRLGRYPINFDKGMPPEYVAGRILDALRRNRTETVIGRDASWMLRANKFFPGLVDRLLARRVRQLWATS